MDSTPISAAPTSGRRGPSPIWLMLFVVGLVVVPYLFWQGTWFGRPLTDEQMAKYLADTKKPRHRQHALSQIADRIIRGDRSVVKWYPRVLELAASPVAEVRLTAAWVMGQDNRSEEFHRALAGLLKDPEPMVRRNAALALVRFGDAHGRPVLAEMLAPYTVAAPAAGSIRFRLKEGETANAGTLLARVSAGGGEPVEVRSPVPGDVKRRLRTDGAQVTAGEPVLEIEPSPEQVWEALRALYLVGLPEDLPAVDRFRQPVPGIADKVARQAQETSQAIRERARAEPAAR